jgi:hypothetical protein
MTRKSLAELRDAMRAVARGEREPPPRPRIPAFTGVCRCGHAFDDHHNSMHLSAEHLATLPDGTRSYIAEECEHYGCNEEGGLGPDLRVHCLRYVDRADPAARVRHRGTFTRLARARAWARFVWQAIQVRILGRNEREVWRRERW